MTIDPPEIKTMHDFMAVLDQHCEDGYWTVIGPNGTMWAGASLPEVISFVDSAIAADALCGGMVQ